MKKKILAISLVVAMLAVAVIGGTLAYFTDTTAEQQNTFKVGGVDIDLTEPAWDATAAHTLVPGTTFAKDPTITVAAGSQDAWVFLKLDMNKYVSLINLMGVDAYKNGVAGLSGNYPGFTAFMTTLLESNSTRETVINRWFSGINHADWKIMNLEEIKTAVSGAASQTNPVLGTMILGYQKSTLKAGESVRFMTGFGIPATVTQSMFDGADAYYINDVNGVSKSASNFNTEKAGFKMTFIACAVQAEGLNTLELAYAQVPAEFRA